MANLGLDYDMNYYIGRVVDSCARRFLNPCVGRFRWFTSAAESSGVDLVASAELSRRARWPLPRLERVSVAGEWTFGCAVSSSSTLRCQSFGDRERFFRTNKDICQ